MAKVQNGMRLPQAHSLFYFGRSASRQQQEPIFRAIIPYSQPKPSSSISELPSRIPSHREKNPQAPVGFPCPLSLFLRNRAPSKLPTILTIPERDKLFYRRGHQSILPRPDAESFASKAGRTGASGQFIDSRSVNLGIPLFGP